MKWPLPTLPQMLLLSLCMSLAANAAAVPKKPKGASKLSHWYHGSWFSVIDGKPSWKDAKKKCEAAGGYLGIIPDAATWAAVKIILPDGDYWLGATDEETEGKWMWVDGTPMTFTSWRGGEPNNLGGTEDYLSSPWADLPVSSDWIKGYLCQWKSFDVLMDYRADVEDQNAEVGAALKKFRQEMGPGIMEAHHTAIVAADAAYTALLTKEAETAAKRSDAPLTKALQDELELIKEGTPIPAEDEKETPPALVKLRKLHREQCQRADDERTRKAAPVVRRYDAVLEKLQADILKSGTAEQSMQIKMIRQSMAGLLQ